MGNGILENRVLTIWKAPQSDACNIKGSWFATCTKTKDDDGWWVGIASSIQLTSAKPKIAEPQQPPKDSLVLLKSKNALSHFPPPRGSFPSRSDLQGPQEIQRPKFHFMSPLLSKNNGPKPTTCHPRCIIIPSIQRTQTTSLSLSLCIRHSFPHSSEPVLPFRPATTSVVKSQFYPHQALQILR